MMEPDEIQKVKEIIEEFLQKMTVTVFSIEAKPSPLKIEGEALQEGGESKDSIDVNISIEEPQVLIGQNGQTLLELQRLLRIVLNKKLQKNFYVNLDIDEYKAKKIEYLKNLAKDSAGQVVLSQEKKLLPPMPAYERRIIHEQLSGRQDIKTESQGEGPERCVVIIPR